LKRSAISRKPWQPRPAKVWEGDSLPTPRAPALRIAETRATLVVPLPKEKPWRCEEYRRAVASLACMNCGIALDVQAAHPNTNKAKGMKADDSLCFPLCAVRFNAPGCHYLFDTHQLFPRSERAAVERKWAAQTKANIKAAGLWKKGWPDV